MSKFDWSKHLTAALESTPFMALSTNGPEGPWNHAVYFAYDRRLNFYFISQPHTRHMRNLSRNPVVALAVFSTAQSPEHDVVGLQIRGTAKIVPDPEVHEAHEIYTSRKPGIPGIPTYLDAYMGGTSDWKIVKVTPVEIGYFDSKNFGEARQTVPKGVKL